MIEIHFDTNWIEELIKWNMQVIIFELPSFALVYVQNQITLLWRYFTLEITLGSKKNYTVYFAITNCQT